MNKRRAVFLDRDGVLNRAVLRNGLPFPPASLEELELLPGVPAACAALRQAGFLLIVVTNQPDISRGSQSLEAVAGMNQWLKRELNLMICASARMTTATHARAASLCLAF